ncbi:DUF1627 domain-containing protein [Salmonella enterica subsp. diarizonae]|uniref:DNA glycosylase AlkZ-like family protein n=1 Tax=Salmonella enterica TaxID=28901 RepID=UPI0009AFFD66|nr:crosslink repair DNA glycosylase YcaQ family protein [Salmonella enterica]EAA6844575.1 DUF1627 domain-containing protein [Salmonella enterica subsp. enterica serovar Pensacola]EAW1825205.1 DUF1627 domain-containing protein [Salmonella enterica subsp. diarizonae]EDT6983893.1 DUF1627 domain-containing protein [Salmonella enterica subsp. arizonae]EAR0004061.1 DUF1627 domain-containing protein [Salmonella enterica]EAT2563572.1 DUF1627 domain-containing protein [Salmonella enterica]
MESVLDALKAMGKATAREIAARLDIEPRDALNMLNEQQEIGTVTFLNGYWSLSGVKPVTAKTVKRKTPKPKNPEDTAAKIGEPQLMDVIREHGPQTAEDLATLFGITSRKVIATLATATGRGRLSRIKQDGKYCYTLPESVSAHEPEPTVEPVADTDSASPDVIVTDKTESSQEVVKTDAQEASDESADAPDIASAGTESVSDIPLADTQPAAPAPDVMELPSPRAVAKNLRRHKAQLARLQKAHSAVQAVRRYGLQVTPAPKEIVREIRRLTAIVEAGTKLGGAVNMAKKYLTRINRYEN